MPSGTKIRWCAYPTPAGFCLLIFFREFFALFRAGREGQGKELKARRKKFRQPKRGRGGRGVWGGIPPRPSAEASKKFSFPFRIKNPARAKEKQRKLFCWLASVSERRRDESIAISFKKGSRKV